MTDFLAARNQQNEALQAVLTATVAATIIVTKMREELAVSYSAKAEADPEPEPALTRCCPFQARRVIFPQFSRNKMAGNFLQLACNWPTP